MWFCEHVDGLLLLTCRLVAQAGLLVRQRAAGHWLLHVLLCCAAVRAHRGMGRRAGWGGGVGLKRHLGWV